MKRIVIKGGNTLTGEINICGAKNSAVALIPASILCDEDVTLYNVPNISDRDALIEILGYLNCDTTLEKDMIKINLNNLENKTIPESLGKKLRASYYFMGALLGKYKKVEMYFPGGCNIGSRPIDLHIKGFEMLGAKVKIEGNKYIITADELVGNRIYLDIASVGATINLMLAASKAKGTTIISNAAREPEITNVATFLNNMGAKISGVGTSEIKIDGVDYLHSAMIDVIPDRIEAGTYAIIGALLGKNLVINNIIEDHLEALLSKLKDMGVDIKCEKNSLIINRPERLQPINIKTLVYPGFPTDLGQPITTLLTQAWGISLFEETIWENRFGHIKYLTKMGATINANTHSMQAIIVGPTKLKGTDVVATDLRAGAALVVAGLIAEGTTTISEIDHILRGYDNIIEKLKNVGANIDITEI